MATNYADRPPQGFVLLNHDEPAEYGDMAFVGHIGGQWVPVRRGMNIEGAALDELLELSSVLALARRAAPKACRGGR